jgi:chemotaxis protein CheC
MLGHLVSSRDPPDQRDKQQPDGRSLHMLVPRRFDEMPPTRKVKPLDTTERDALAEIANVAMGRAATSLRQLVHNEVTLAVPSIEILPDSEAVRLIAKSEQPQLIAVHEDFRGLFSGRALLIFPEANSLELVRAIVGRDISLDEIAELETEAIQETGNIVLNCWISTLANLLKHNLVMSVPQVIRGEGPAIFQSTEAKLVLFLHINFAIRAIKISGYLALLMDLPSMEALRTLISDYVASFDR